MVSANLDEPSRADERREVEDHAAGERVAQAGESTALVEAGGGLVDRVRDEEPERDRAGTGKLEGEPERFLEKVPPEPLALDARVDRKTGEEDARDREPRVAPANP